MQWYEVLINFEMSGTVRVQASSAESAEELVQRNYVDRGVVPAEAYLVESQILCDHTKPIDIEQRSAQAIVADLQVLANSLGAGDSHATVVEAIDYIRNGPAAP